MSTDETSCSDCKQEIVQHKWTRILIDWINTCVMTKKKIRRLKSSYLVEVMQKYKTDVCSATDRPVMASTDLEALFKIKYPLLRLRYLTQDKDIPKRIYIMTSVLLYHCCANSTTGIVDREICSHLPRAAQEIIIKYCEMLTEMEVTVNNVETAIRASFEDASKRYPQLLKVPLDYTTTDPSELTIDRSRTPNMSDMSLKITLANFNTTDPITILPTVVTDSSSFVKSSDSGVNCIGRKMGDILPIQDITMNNSACDDKIINEPSNADKESADTKKCQPDYSCPKSLKDTCCGEPGRSVTECPSTEKPQTALFCWNLIGVSIVLLILLIVLAVSTIPSKSNPPQNSPRTLDKILSKRNTFNDTFHSLPLLWRCSNNICERVLKPSNSSNMYSSHSRCLLSCIGPQLWPVPNGYAYYGNKIIAITTEMINYNVKKGSYDTQQVFAEAYKLFIDELRTLEAKGTKTEQDLSIMPLNINVYVESDDVIFRVNTTENYFIQVETIDDIVVNIRAVTYFGTRHGLQTLSQLILLDETTGYLIILSETSIQDSPSYNYRGLMLETGKNYIPVDNILRTVDAMSEVKMNTFHWRISDVTSFPLILPSIPKLREYGPYDNKLVYTKDDVKTIVNRATIRGIRVLLEVTLPGPVGRPWVWSDVSDGKNGSWSMLCLRLNMENEVFDIIQQIYTEIIEMTKITDIFHLSHGLFSLSNCFNLIEDRKDFLRNALYRLKAAIGKSLKLPVVWYTRDLVNSLRSIIWDDFGVQLTGSEANTVYNLGNFKVIHSSHWDLSCIMKNLHCFKYRTWQEMYAWKSWRNIDAASIEGGEAILWSDLIDSGNLEYHLWPRVAAVAERLWSDAATNSSADGHVYTRLDILRSRLQLIGVRGRPVWPKWCSFNPGVCIRRLNRDHVT